jgi:excisionase family DNA binding protein
MFNTTAEDHYDRGEEQTFTTEETSRLLHVTEAWVRELCRRGEIRAGRRGRRWLIFRDDLLRSLRP